MLLSSIPATDPYWDSVVTMLHFNGTNGSTTFTDSRGLRSWTRVNATISTAQSKFGGSSGLFSGNGYLQTADSADFQFAGGDFTIEAWVRMTSWPGAGWWSSIISQRSNNSSQNSFTVSVYGDGSYIDFYYGNPANGGAGTQYTMPFAYQLNTWYHVAVSRVGTNLYMFLDGVKKTTANIGTAVLWNSTATIKVGAFDDGPWSNSYFFGYIDELRVTKGVGRYVNDFTPRSWQFPDRKR